MPMWAGAVRAGAAGDGDDVNMGGSIMAIAPEPYLSACLAVMRHAILSARFGHWRQTISHEQTADLMDSIHNLPSLLKCWERCNVEWLREALQGYDRKWATPDEPCLCAVFDDIVAGQSSQSGT
jgi:hypothetical protein